mmetsp:Transcript_69958/g.167068  ORF Transcript_69958/g.167068 Transcript_69958/m.167068 type:complete len:214 (-) Transcript_69958:454-1095(-)
MLVPLAHPDPQLAWLSGPSWLCLLVLFFDWPEHANHQVFAKIRHMVFDQQPAHEVQLVNVCHLIPELQAQGVLLEAADEAAAFASSEVHLPKLLHLRWAPLQEVLLLGCGPSLPLPCQPLLRRRHHGCRSRRPHQNVRLCVGTHAKGERREAFMQRLQRHMYGHAASILCVQVCVLRPRVGGHSDDHGAFQLKIISKVVCEHLPQGLIPAQQR